MKILVTGGFGFIGGRIAEKFIAEGHQVILGSRSLREVPFPADNAVVKKINWKCDDSLYDACEGIDSVIHAAGMGAPECVDNPIEALSFNGLATSKLVVAAIKAKVRKFIYISTAHVYASNLEGKITENTPPRNLNPYATSHLAGENFLLYQDLLHRIDGTVIRLSNTFGIPAIDNQQCWNLLINDLCMQATKIQEIRLKSNGKHQRNFISASEVCSAITKILDSHGKYKNIINLGGNDYTVLQISEIIRQRCMDLFNFQPIIHVTEEDNYYCHEKLQFYSNVLAGYGVTIADDIQDQLDILLKACMNFPIGDKSFGPYLLDLKN